MPFPDTFRMVKQVTGWIKIWKDDKENEHNWLWLCVTVAMPSSSVFAVSTRSYVVITFASPSRCVVT